MREIEPLLHTILEASARLRISRTTLYELIKAGEIAVIKIGDRTLIEEDEIRRYVAANRQHGVRAQQGER